MLAPLVRPLLHETLHPLIAQDPRPPLSGHVPALLTESGDFIVTESGNRIILEPST